jgi:hypothetical protein
MIATPASHNNPHVCFDTASASLPGNSFLFERQYYTVTHNTPIKAETTGERSPP